MQKHYEIDSSLNIRKAGVSVFYIVRWILSFLAVSILLALLYYVIFSLIISTDTEKLLNEENRMYEKIYPELVEQDALVRDVIAGLEIRDDEIYKAVFLTQAPLLDPTASLGFLAAPDSVSNEYITAYTRNKISNIEDRATVVAENIRRILAASCATGISKLPPMAIPIRNLSYPQVGASQGEKINPYYKVHVRHNGVDLIAPHGEPVYATDAGVVSLVRRSNKGEGNVVEITHPNSGFVTRYTHLAEIFVSRGQNVKLGRKIASVGVSGNTYAPHLHYEVIKAGVPVDPVNYFFASLTPAEYANILYMASNTRQSLD